MKNILVRLSECFYDVPGAKRIVEIVLTKAEKFSTNIPILETICNPGLQERHWEKVSDTCNFDYPSSILHIAKVYLPSSLTEFLYFQCPLLVFFSFSR